MNRRRRKRLAGSLVAGGGEIRLKRASLLYVKFLEVAIFGLLLETINRLRDRVERRLVATFCVLQIFKISALDALTECVNDFETAGIGI